MKTWKKIISGIVILILLLVVCLVFAIYYFGSDMCGNHIHKEYVSPDSSLKAVVFQRDCGATTGFSTQVSILSFKDKLKNNSGDVYIIKGIPKYVAPNISWLGNSKLHIQTTINGTEFKVEKNWGLINKVDIVYDNNNS